MSDFDSSVDSAESTESESDAETVDVSEAETTIESEDDESSVDISEEEQSVEVSYDADDESSISIADDTEDVSSVDIGDVDVDENIDAEENVDAEENADAEENSEEDSEVPENEETDEESLKSEELREYLEKESPYSAEVNEHISSPEELDVYKQAGLVEKNVNGRICLIREDLDMEHVDKESGGLTNAQLIAKGRAPYDPKTGEKIELHHMQQDFNAPFVELRAISEHDLHTKTLHQSETESWRRDPEKVKEYRRQKNAHWKSRL